MFLTIKALEPGFTGKTYNSVTRGVIIHGIRSYYSWRIWKPALYLGVYYYRHDFRAAVPVPAKEA
jgi:hypothetical protein